MKTFPEGFLWGAATASYQVEGGIENNDWAEAARKGRVPVCGRACDHYSLYEKDFDLVQMLGHNTHKISLEWARIEPQEGVFDEKEIEHYRRVIDALHRRNIKPIVNMWHFTLPLWFTAKGGFENSQAPIIFARYCNYVMSKLGDKADTWITINEPIVWSSNGYVRGNWPPFKRNPFTFLRVFKLLVRSHNAAYEAMKKVRVDIHIGVAKNNIYFHSNNNPFNICAAWFMTWLWNRRFLNGISKHQDFIGLNYYFHRKFGDRMTYETTDMGWDIYPDGLFHLLVDLKRYNKPVMVVENGIADADDSKRAEFIKTHIDAVHRAITAGVPVFGYLHWSLLDNYEWALGFEKRFGLVEVNYNTLKRTVRPSALEYKKICDTNAL